MYCVSAMRKRLIQVPLPWTPAPPTPSPRIPQLSSAWWSLWCQLSEWLFRVCRHMSKWNHKQVSPWGTFYPGPVPLLYFSSGVRWVLHVLPFTSDMAKRDQEPFVWWGEEKWWVSESLCDCTSHSANTCSAFCCFPLTEPMLWQLSAAAICWYLVECLACVFFHLISQ